MKREAGGPLLDPQSRAWALLASGACLLPLLLQLPAGLGIAIGAAAVLVGAVAWRRVLPGWIRLLLALAVFASLVHVCSRSPCRFSVPRKTMIPRSPIVLMSSPGTLSVRVIVALRL